jgi:hypothetical protein
MEMYGAPQWNADQRGKQTGRPRNPQGPARHLQHFRVKRYQELHGLGKAVPYFSQLLPSAPICYLLPQASYLPVQITLPAQSGHYFEFDLTSQPHFLHFTLL